MIDEPEVLIARLENRMIGKSDDRGKD